MKSDQSLLDKCYKDANGRVVVGQFPNAPIITWIVATVLAKLVSNTELTSLLQVVAFGAIFTWAWLEMFQGVTYLRRVLGLVVMIVAVSNMIS